MLAKFLFVALATLAAALPAAEPVFERAAAATATPDPTQVYLNGYAYGGTGCPQGSVGAFLSTNRQTFTLIFDSYVASIGPGVSVVNKRKNCQLNLDLQYPSGFQYSVLSTVFRGYVGIDKGVTATQSAIYYFSGGKNLHPFPFLLSRPIPRLTPLSSETSQTTTSTTFKGPLSQDYEVEDDVDLTSVVWSPCGAPVALNVNSAVLLTSSVSTASGQITDDSIDGKITFIAGVQWQKC